MISIKAALGRITAFCPQRWVKKRGTCRCTNYPSEWGLVPYQFDNNWYAESLQHLAAGRSERDVIRSCYALVKRSPHPHSAS